MSARAIAAWCLIVLTVGPLHASEVDGPRLRGDDAYARWLIRSAIKHSPTTADLVARLEATDVVAYVSTTLKAGPFLAHTRLINGAGPIRYILISLSAAEHPRRLMELLGHELHHVTEIADHPDVRDANAMRALFSRIGREHVSDHFETSDAIQVGLRVRGELERYPVWLLAASAPSAH
jgi:hypothetical protein